MKYYIQHGVAPSILLLLLLSLFSPSCSPVLPCSGAGLYTSNAGYSLDQNLFINNVDILNTILTLNRTVSQLSATVQSQSAQISSLISSTTSSVLVDSYFPTVKTTSGTGWQLLAGSLQIPAAGLWRVSGQVRFQYTGAVNLWVKCSWFVSPILGVGEIVDPSGNSQQRQLLNSVGALNGGMNILIVPECK